MYLAKILLLSSTLAMTTALPMYSPPSGNNSKAEQCKEDLSGLNTALANASAAAAEALALFIPGADVAQEAAVAAANAEADQQRQIAAAYAAEMNDLGCAQ